MFNPEDQFKNTSGPDPSPILVPMGPVKLQQLGIEFQLDYEVKMIIPVVRKIWGEIIFWFLTLITAGLFYLFCRWNHRLFKSLRFSQVPTQQATHLILLDEGDEEVLVEILIIKGQKGENLISVEYRYTTYIFDQDAENRVNTKNKGAFMMIRNNLSISNNQVRSGKEGLKTEEIEPLRRLYGPNSTQIKLTPIWNIFIDEALGSFNLYQIFAAIIWWFREYFAYAVFILVMAFISLIITIWVFRKEQNRINKMAQKEMVHVYRKENGTIKRTQILSTELVPGDVFEVQPSKQMVCDAILIEGVCLLDEAALTGESVPMHKTQLPGTPQTFSESDKIHLLYSGTFVMTSERLEDPTKLALAMVYQTGFNTGKGMLIRAIMFNNPGQYQFEKDASKFILYLILISICFIIIYYIVAYTDEVKPPFVEVFLPSVDIMLCMVPPGLTVTLSLGVQYAQGRLAMRKVNVLKGRLINAAGRMKVCLFDKTGTLTVTDVVLEEVYFNNKQVDDKRCVKLTKQVAGHESDGHLRYIHNFATNHTLIKMTDVVNTMATGDKTKKAPLTIGDPLEDELLNFAKGHIEDSTEHNGKKYIKLIRIGDGKQDLLGVLNVFGFKSELQRMGVVAEDPKTQQIYCYIKGAPERIVELSDPASLPKDINQQIADFAKSGYRVIAFACNKLQPIAPGQEYTREQGEKGAQFQGLALFKNNLKTATKPTLDKLKQNDFYTGMITGDNINTAISVSKSCGIIDVNIEDTAMCSYTQGSGKLTYTLLNAVGDKVGEIDIKAKNPSGKLIIGAIDDKTFEIITKDLGLELNKPVDLVKGPVLVELCKHVRVFARMNPQQKALIVKTFKEYYKSQNYTVGFCGDGANDCIALKHADIGVSLSKNEASLSAPFISSIEDISAMETVSIIGKCALTTNYDCFRYFCLYSIIQTIGLVMLFTLKTEYSVPMFLTMDVPIALNVANAMGLMAPLPGLTKKLPKHTLIYKKYIISIVLNSVYTFGFMIFGAWMMRANSNFVSAKSMSTEAIDNELPTFESTIISLLALQGTIHLGISFNIAGFFKLRFYRQIYIIISMILYILYQVYLIFNARTFWPAVDNFLMDNYNFVVMESKVRWYTVILLLVYSLFSIGSEALLIWVFVGKKNSNHVSDMQKANVVVRG